MSLFQHLVLSKYLNEVNQKDQMLKSDINIMEYEIDQIV